MTSPFANMSPDDMMMSQLANVRTDGIPTPQWSVIHMACRSFVHVEIAYYPSISLYGRYVHLRVQQPWQQQGWYRFQCHNERPHPVSPTGRVELMKDSYLNFCCRKSSLNGYRDRLNPPKLHVRHRPVNAKTSSLVPTLSSSSFTVH